MFNGKKIKQLERDMAYMKLQLDEVSAEVRCLRGMVDLLKTNDVVSMFDTDDLISLLQTEDGENQDKIETVLRMKEDYEKKLRRFIRQITSKRKIVKNGKENQTSDK